MNQYADDNTQSWMDFAQRPYDEGGLGLAKHQAAGLVGNLIQESGAGLPAWGPTGDGNTAWGTAQWRNERLNALKQMFPDTYQTPEAQQAFMRHEFDTTHNRAYQALQGAQDPASAANAVNRFYEISADTSGKRAAYAQALNDGTNPAVAAINSAIRARSPGALSFAPEASDAPKGALSADETIGPGVLIPGVRADGGDRLNNIGQALTGIGASLAGISNPEQSKALIAQLAAMQKVAGAGNAWTAIGSRDKNGYQLMGRPDGSVIRMKAGAAEEDPGDIEQKKLEAKGAYEKYQSTQDAITNADDQLRNIAMLRKALSDPNVTLGGLGDAAATAKNIAYSMGIDVKGLDNTQTIQRVATQMQLSRGKMLPGAISNYEDKLMGLANGVGIDKTKEANMAALDAQEAIWNHQKTLAKAARAYKDKYGKLDDGWDAYRSQFAPAETPAAASTPSLKAPAAPVKSFKTKNGTGWSINQ